MGLYYICVRCRAQKKRARLQKIKDERREKEETIAGYVKGLKKQGLVVTRGVAARLRRGIPKTEEESQGPEMPEKPRAARVLEGVLTLLVPVVPISFFTAPFFNGGLLVLVALAVVVVGGLVIVNRLERPWRQAMEVWREETKLAREQYVAGKITDLARERAEKIAEAERFYASPEWRELRARVIAEDGRVCVVCSVMVVDERDLTVDHLLPRSKYPERALDRTNLRVMCRPCNSAKGARVDEVTEADAT